MKKNSDSQSGFFNLRVLITSVLCSIGLFLALLGSGAKDNGIFAFGGADINLITGTETSPHITQDTSATWGHGNTVVVTYQDSSGFTLSPLSYCGVSTSTDGGATFTRLPEKFNTGGACSGYSSVVYSVRAAKWFASFLAGRCGGQGVGIWTSLDGITWSNGSCASSSSQDDLLSIWVDNNPASPFYGRQYALFNDYNVGGGAVQVTRSTDDGVTWSAPVTVLGSFRRAWKVTGSLGADGTIFAQTLEEGGGGLSGPRQNFIHRSTDGGVTWSAAIAQGATFLGPGRSVGGGGYFAGMYSTPVAGYWTEMGWGEPAVGPNGVVHYAYSAHGTGVDPGDILYVRSTDTGLTWSAPLKLNTDATTRAQWSPSLSVNTQGNVFVSWYDERNTSTDALERFGRASTDNGATWGSDMALSDVIFPKPLQPDPNVQPTGVGLFNRTAFSNDGTGETAYHAWTDGRVSIGGSPQQDVFFDKISFTLGACGLVNDGFETGSFPPWVILDTQPAPFVSSAQAHSGTFSAFLGSPVGGGETPGNSSIYQTITVPAGGGMLTFWYRPSSVDSITFDWQDAYVADATGTTTLATIMHVCQSTNTWTLVTYDMAAFAGQTVSIKFLVHGDNAGDPTSMFVDDVCLPSAATPTPTPTPAATPTPTPATTPTPTPASTPTPTPTPTPAAQAINLSTRMRVQTGDNVGIGGFIITGTVPKHVLIRAIGPSLTQFGVPDALADPVLELHGPGGFGTITNNDWRDTQEAAILATGIPPTNDLESAIDATLASGPYTAIVRGNGNTSGVALIEVYDLNQAVASKLANISTRAFVSTGDNIVIAGFILGNGNGNDRIVVRGIGPSLTAAGVANALADPTLELRDTNGTLILANNDWQDNPAQAAELTAAGLAPTNNLESAIATTLPPGPYTALLAGLNNGTGVGLVEVYDRGGGP